MADWRQDPSFINAEEVRQKQIEAERALQEKVLTAARAAIQKSNQVFEEFVERARASGNYSSLPSVSRTMNDTQVTLSSPFQRILVSLSADGMGVVVLPNSERIELIYNRQKEVFVRATEQHRALDLDQLFGHLAVDTFRPR